MKKYNLYKIVFAFIVLHACISNQKMQYAFPDEMADNIKAQYFIECEKGRLMYEQNCSGCHTQVVNKKRLIPDFTTEQLSNYEFRFANQNHSDSLTESRLTQDQLVTIITFLAYKPKSGIIVKSSVKDSTEHDHK